MDAELVHSFLTEARELLEGAEHSLVDLQARLAHEEVEDKSALDSVNLAFRMFHSLKGGAAFLNLNNIADVTHKAESLLDILRSGAMGSCAETLDVVLRAADFVGMLLVRAEQSGSDTGYEAQVAVMSDELSAYTSKLSALSTANAVETPIEGATLDIPFFSITSEMTDRFVKESQEKLDQLEQLGMALERSRGNADEVDEFLRLIHSFKGNCGFLGYGEMEKLSHRLEAIFESVRDSDMPFANQLSSLTLKTLDTLKSGVACVAEGRSVVMINADGLLESLERVISSSAGVDESSTLLGDILVSKGLASEAAVQAALHQQEKPLGQLMVDMGYVEPSAVSEALKIQAERKGVQDHKPATSQDIRVSLAKLDSLMNLVGELVIAGAMAARRPDRKDFKIEDFESSALQLQRVTTELQEVVMDMRMVPVSGVFKKLIRVVHDISRKSGKKVKINFTGEDTEVDKTVIELLSDPLVHMIRNSLDHGVETPEERLANGKPETGVIHIEAKHEGGEVWITVSDDGRGLNRERILAKAISKGLIRGDGADIPDDNVFKQIFEPGFSTAEQVTEISGRGVGMDVVKGNIEKIKGRIEIRSEWGKGTSFIIHIPLTLAIIDGMLTRVGNSKHTIPMLSIRESFRPESCMITITPGGQELVRVREEIIPVLRLSDIYGGNGGTLRLEDGVLVVVETEGNLAALFVDELLGQNQTVIKALPHYLRNVRGVSSCTVLGDGEVSLILDIRKIVEMAMAQDEVEVLA